MSVRQASRVDIPAMAAVVARAYGDQRLFDLLHPHKDEYPEDWRKHWERDFQARMNDPSKVMLVSEEVEDDTEPGKRKIVGVCCWQRLGDSNPTMRRRMRDYGGWVTWFQEVFSASILCPSAHISSRRSPDRSADPSKASLATEYIQNLFNQYCADLELYFVWTMAVYPDYQRRGHGRKMLDWGLGKARAEGVEVRLLSSPTAEPFYSRAGFEVLGKGNLPPLEDVEFGPVMRWKG